MSHWHIAHGLQGYGPDGADGFGFADSLEAAAEYARAELDDDVHYCEESAEAYAAAGEFEQAWLEHKRADSLDILSRNLDPARSSAPLYVDNRELWESTLLGLLESSFPAAISHATSLYVWQCDEPDCEHVEEES